MQDPDGDGRYQFVTAAIPPGDYEAKIAINQSWDENYGADGVADGGNIPFTVTEGAEGASVAVIFTYSPGSHLLEISLGDAAITEGMVSGGPSGLPAPAIAKPDLVVIPGTIQSVLGCPGDWQPDCEITALQFDEANQVWANSFTLPAGEYEYKAAIGGNWDINFGLDAQPGGPNISLSLSEETAVTFLFDHNTGWVMDDVNTLIANVPGDFQEEIGCANDWASDCLRTWLQDPDGDGIYTFRTLSIPAGDYEAKVAVGQSWSENYGDGGAADGPNIPFTVPADGELVSFAWDSASKVLSIGVGETAGPRGSIKQAKAHWVTADTIAWDVDTETADSFALHYSPTGAALSLSESGVKGGQAIPLTLDANGLSDDILAKFPHLAGFAALKISPDDLGKVRIALKGQTAVSAANSDGPVDAAGLQIPGVLDDLYAYDGPLGVTFADGAPTLRVWAPTARLVKLRLFADLNSSQAESLPMRIDPKTGVWSITGDASWNGRPYLYEVQVYVPGEGALNNLVTDPYSLSLTMNSQRSQIVDLDDPALLPNGWETLTKPPLAAPEEIVLYELQVRDFSMNDASVPEELRGKYLAFSQSDSNGMQHLARLAQAGVTHIHLLPTFDIATIEENPANRAEPDMAELAAFPPDSEEQQAIISALADKDGFNWGYDPYHYLVPEGSYATDADGPARILEYRQMVQALNQTNLRVVADVVFNHTNASGQRDRSVLDRIVPGYYHRLNAGGKVENSTCCANTATEHTMMRKLMVDTVVLWAKAYKIDGFRFDLMGHHMKEDMLAVRAALDALTLENDGVDGRSIFIYGEGWDFGEVANNNRGVNATQLNMPGTGIGTFNDRVRDSLRGGSPFGGRQEQGFINGLYTNPNETDQGPAGAQLGRLLLFADRIRVSLAGNLADYEFVGFAGDVVTGAEVDYNGSPTGYAQDPQENIVYASAHDNETLFDAIQYKAPLATSTAVRARMQAMGFSVVGLSQGVPFFHAGTELLRSKSFDRDSFNSGDWFNRLDFTYQENNFGAGLPPKGKNQEMWPVMAPLLGNPAIKPTPEDIAFTLARFEEILQIRRSSPLFRLRTAVQIQERVAFHNTGPEQIPGLIVMSISDTVGEDLDPARDGIVALFNASAEPVSFTLADAVGTSYTPHRVQLASADPVVRQAMFNIATGMFTVPALTTAVFESSQTEQVEVTVVPQAASTAETVTAVSTPTEPAVTAEPAATDNDAPWSVIGGGLAALAAAGAAAWVYRRRKQVQEERK